VEPAWLTERARILEQQAQADEHGINHGDDGEGNREDGTLSAYS
jgi:hypothetical protein